MTTDLLFAYGTLMRGFALHHLLHGRAEYDGEASIRGRLVDLGAYPAAIPDGTSAIHGELYRVRDAGFWAVLDVAEGPQYRRDQVDVQRADGRGERAFTYWYVGGLERAVPVRGGDYRAHVPARSIHR